jgi:hypothetical protein
LDYVHSRYYQHSEDKLPVIRNVFLFSLTIHSIHRQSGRLILCTIPPRILCRPNTVRYALVLNVHDQRQRRGTVPSRYVKVSSPTLRKLCLPCITARHHRQQYNRSRQAAKSKTFKNNPQHIIAPSTSGNIGPSEPAHRLEANPETHDSVSTTPVVHSRECLRANDVNQSAEQYQHFAKTSFPSEGRDEKNDEISVQAELIATEVVAESVLPTSPSPKNELTRSNEEDVVGALLDTSLINLRVVIKMIMSFIFFSFIFSFLFLF